MDKQKKDKKEEQHFCSQCHELFEDCDCACEEAGIKGKSKKEDKKILICPRCKTEIDSLDYDVTTTCSGTITQDEVRQGLVTEYDSDCLYSNAEFSDFRCPECSALIGKGTEEDARKFLKGELK